jgi:hypothetical protein
VVRKCESRAALLRGKAPYFLSVDEPYRSELESLRADNERLRIELAKRRVNKPVLALVLAVLDLAMVVVLRPWLNGPSDGGFWAALSVVVAVALGAVGAALGRRVVA